MFMSSFYEHTLETINGESCSLKKYAGRVCLVVNVASECGKTPQYQGLQVIYDEYRDRGLEVLGVPCNQFGSQEPGNEKEIRAFCTNNYGITFPMFAKVDVNGAGRNSLYAWLTEQDTQPDGAGDISWNFTKFLVNREGQVGARFGPDVEPESTDLLKAINVAL